MAQLRRVPDDFSILAGLLEKVLLDDDLDTGEGPYTLFAPTNKALANFDTSSPLEVRNLILYHLVPLNFVTKVAETGQLPTLLNIPMDVVVNEEAATVLINGVLLQKQFDNQLASNGVIHILTENVLQVPEGYTKAPSSAPSDAPETLAPTIPVTNVDNSPAPNEDELNAGVNFQPGLFTANGDPENNSTPSKATTTTASRRWHGLFVWITATSMVSAAWLL